MHLLPSKFFDALNLWPCWLVQLPNSTDQEITLYLVLRVELCLFAAFRCCDSRPPFLKFVIPGSIFNSGVEADVLVELVLLRYAGKIGEDLLLAGVLASPVAVLREAIAIER